MSGKSAIKYKLRELGIEVPEMKLPEILTKVKEEDALRIPFQMM
jgi:isopropylmalate/homocitrate/citramalate synthase